MVFCHYFLRGNQDFATFSRTWRVHPSAFFWKMGKKLSSFLKSVFHNYEIIGYGKIQQQSLTINDDFYGQNRTHPMGEKKIIFMCDFSLWSLYCIIPQWFFPRNIDYYIVLTRWVFNFLPFSFPIMRIGSSRRINLCVFGDCAHSIDDGLFSIYCMFLPGHDQLNGDGEILPLIVGWLL